MSEFLRHPGYINYSTPNFDEYLAEKRAKIKFGDFLPFVSTQGLEEIISKSFLVFLRKLFVTTKDYWEPGKCFNTEFILPEARNIMEEIAFPNGPQVEARQTSHVHFWIELMFQHMNQALVVDPSGIPATPIVYTQENVLPYFGLPQNAGEFARRVYERGKSLDDWGYKSFLPGFHP